jgi:hypothetical protein
MQAVFAALQHFFRRRFRVLQNCHNIAFGPGLTQIKAGSGGGG